MLKRLFLLVLLVAACTAAAATQPVATLPLDRPWLGLPQVPVTLNRRVEGRFIVDTAATETVLSDAMIGELGLAGTGEPAHVNAATGRTALSYYRLGSLDLGGREYRNLGAYDFPRLSAPVESDGLLGADVLRRHVVEFDIPAGALRLWSRRVNLARESGDWSVVPVRQRPDGFLIVPVTIGRLTLPALVDTGAVHNFVNAEAARRLGLRLVEGSASRETITGASGHVQAMTMLELSGFSIGDVRFGASRLGVVDLAIFEALGMDGGPAMILSADALADRRFAIDYPRSRMLIARDPG